MSFTNPGDLRIIFERVNKSHILLPLKSFLIIDPVAFHFISYIHAKKQVFYFYNISGDAII